MGARLEVVEKELAKERHREGGGDRKSAEAKEKSVGGKFPPTDPEPAVAGKTNNRVGAAVGLSGRTLQKAKTVIAMAEEDPDTFGAIAAEMEKTGKVDPAYKKVQAIRKEGKRQEPSTDSGRRVTLDPRAEAGLDQVVEGPFRVGAAGPLPGVGLPRGASSWRTPVQSGGVYPVAASVGALPGRGQAEVGLPPASIRALAAASISAERRSSSPGVTSRSSARKK